MFIDLPACDAFWAAYLGQLPAHHPHRAAKPDAFGFGGEPELAEELALLTLAGRKRATTSMPIEYTALNEALPRVGDLSIIVGGKGTPVAIIERTDVDLRLFDSVSAHFAAIEGEGDGSLAYWREAHIQYFTAVAERMGVTFDGATPVICQVFRLVWPIPT